MTEKIKDQGTIPARSSHSRRSRGRQAVVRRGPGRPPGQTQVQGGQRNMSHSIVEACNHKLRMKKKVTNLSLWSITMMPLLLLLQLTVYKRKLKIGSLEREVLV